jgi:SAM-dependent methyltransferase
MAEHPNSQAFFEAKYQSAADPWDFATSQYEQQRFSATLNALGGRRFSRAFEPGCSIGILTERLAGICRRVEAMDISPTAVALARDRCRPYPNVSVIQGAVPDVMPEGLFDLIMFSEIGYYFDFDALQGLAAQLIAHLSRRGILIAVHWLGTSPDHRLTGDQVHRFLARIPGLLPDVSQRHKGFRLDSWTRM